ncbi:hypothetical protein Tsubulata_044199 [Turnera subulata]|uniref:Uncharacterized protein n=1 Tax=Turnera subulata TaxID=218843 RepID=A0A9Q0FWV8_9ROSI|nr:hypothetical protein Tsubulata_044199 [Turnera subulata]
MFLVLQTVSHQVGKRSRSNSSNHQETLLMCSLPTKEKSRTLQTLFTTAKQMLYIRFVFCSLCFAEKSR